MPFAKTSPEYKDLSYAVELLNSPTITAAISSFVGSPIEAVVKSKKMPRFITRGIQISTEFALKKAVSAALLSMRNSPGMEASTKTNKLFAAVSGGVGGFFGLGALIIELPVTTILLMRSVIDVARSEGFDIEDFSTKVACIEVFALGGDTKKDDAADSGYYATRTFLSQANKALTAELGKVAQETAITGARMAVKPADAAKWLTVLIQKVAARFGVVITEKGVAQAMPIVGAAVGASINTMFTDYYQDMARGHFIVKRLEAQYGESEVRKQYTKILKSAAFVE